MTQRTASEGSARAEGDARSKLLKFDVFSSKNCGKYMNESNFYILLV